MRRSRLQRRSGFWTRERIILGMKRFYADFGFCPTDQGKYAEHSQFTGIDPETGRHSNLGWHQKYPSSSSILQKFVTMREAWEAAGFDVDHIGQEWSAIEDWFIVESCGVLAREEVADLLKRTVPAVKRRLYDLGNITAQRRWGWTLTAVSKRLGISTSIILRYIHHGIIPCFRGYKLVYINPADLTKIEEVDWHGTSHDTRESVRRCLIQRAVKILKFRGSWRDHEVYKFMPKPDLFTRRITRPRTPSLLKNPAPAKPNTIVVGDWITTTQTIFGRAGRTGRVLAVHYSPQVCNRRDGSYRATWIARIEFPRLRACRAEQANEKRIMYSLPLDTLVKIEPPKKKERELSMHPVAIRGRSRRGEYRQRSAKAQERLKEFVAS